MPNFPTMKANELLAILMKNPLNYRIMRIRGSHRTLVSNERPRILFSYHASEELSGFKVKKILINGVGLSESEALEVLR
jgi:predicted RNA binding protein YcfA (HicA-like mRNA interferase family)